MIIKKWSELYVWWRAFYVMMNNEESTYIKVRGGTQEIVHLNMLKNCR